MVAKKARKQREPQLPIYAPKKKGEEFDRGYTSLALNTKELNDLSERFDKYLEEFGEGGPTKADIIRWLISDCIATGRTPPWLEK